MEQAQQTRETEPLAGHTGGGMSADELEHALKHDRARRETVVRNSPEQLVAAAELAKAQQAQLDVEGSASPPPPPQTITKEQAMERWKLRNEFLCLQMANAFVEIADATMTDTMRIIGDPKIDDKSKKNARKNFSEIAKFLVMARDARAAGER